MPTRPAEYCGFQVQKRASLGLLSQGAYCSITKIVGGSSNFRRRFR